MLDNTCGYTGGKFKFLAAISAIRIIQITANSSGTQLTRATKLFYKDYSRLQTLSLLSSEKVGGATRMATSGKGICIVVSYPSTLQSTVWLSDLTVIGCGHIVCFFRLQEKLQEKLQDCGV